MQLDKEWERRRAGKKENEEINEKNERERRRGRREEAEIDYSQFLTGREEGWDCGRKDEERKAWVAARVWRQEGGAEAEREGEKRKCLKMRLLHRFKMSNSKGTLEAGFLHSNITHWRLRVWTRSIYRPSAWEPWITAEHTLKNTVMHWKSIHIHKQSPWPREAIFTPTE